MNSMSNAQKQLVVGELGKEHLVIRGNVFFSASKKHGFNISFSHSRNKGNSKMSFPFSNWWDMDSVCGVYSYQGSIMQMHGKLE